MSTISSFHGSDLEKVAEHFLRILSSTSVLM